MEQKMPNQFSEITRHTEQNLEKVIEYVKNKPTSLANACKELNISYPCAYRLIKQSEHRNLISRSRNGKKEIYNNVSRKRSKINDSNVEKVKTLYFEEMLTLKDLSEVFETSAATVLHFFRKHNLKTRTKSEANFLKYEKNKSPFTGPYKAYSIVDFKVLNAECNQAQQGIVYTKELFWLRNL